MVAAQRCFLLVVETYQRNLPGLRNTIMSKGMTSSTSKISVLFSIVIVCLLAVVTLATFPSISSPIGGVSGLIELLKDPGRKKLPSKSALADVALTPFSTTADTGEKPQSKVWKHDGRWWAVMPSSSPSGTWVWRLEADNSWTNVLQLSSSTGTRADVKAIGGVAHVLLYGSSPSLVSIEYVSATTTYQLWSARPTPTAISLPDSETATIDVDSTGRMWLATENGSNVNVHHSVSPYSTFSAPITLANNIGSDDIAAIIAMPGNRVGVLWSNQSTQQFGFRIRNDADDPATWGPDEAPASEATGAVADDHLNLKVAPDGTLFAAIKTSYDAAGMTRIGLLVRRATGVWEPLYSVSNTGTRGIALLNDSTNKVRVVYTSSEGSGNILYRESDTSTIAFGPVQTLMSGSLNNPTSTKANWSSDVVVLAASSSQTNGIRVEDGTPPPTPTPTPEPTATPVPTPTPEPTPDNSLVGHWKMDETLAGSTAADTGELPANNAGTSNTPTFTAGKYGNALTLNGTNQYATAADEDSLDLSTGMTVAAWIKPSKNGTQNILKKTVGTSTANGYELSLSGNNTVFVRLNGNASYRIDSTTLHPSSGSQWMHVAATLSGGVIRLYINGAQEGGDKAMPVAIAPNATELRIGRDTGTGTNYFGGQIDDLRLYNRGLGLSEIQILAEVAPTNTAPTVNAGADQSVTLPATASLAGTVTDDGLPAPPALTTTWSTVTAPGTVTFGDANATSTSASFSAPGIYVLRLTASDGVFSTTDDVQVTVNNTDGFPPAVGHWKMDDDGLGPQLTDSSRNGLHGTLLNGPTFVPGQIGTHGVNFDGTDDRATVADNSLLDITGPITIALWVRPEVLDTQHIFKKGINTSGANSGYEVSLASGSSTSRIFARFQTSIGTIRIDANDPYALNTWTHVVAISDGSQVRMYINGVLQNDIKISGLNVANDQLLGIGAQPNSPSGSNFLNGQMDDIRLYGSVLSQAQITQLATVPVNLAPSVSAGDDQTVVLPATANLSGTANDDGLPAPASLSTTWSKVSGAGDVTFGDAGSLITTATFSAADTYVLRLTATDGELTSTDDIQVTVTAAPTNAAPTVNAGADQTITLPGNAALAGTANDDGLPSGTLTTTWGIVSGPGTVTFGAAGSLSTLADFSLPGVYVLSLTASDGVLQTVDTVQITVNEAPTGPVLVGHWPVDEGIGSQINDLSGQNNHGIISGNPVWSADRIQGPFSFDLDGTGDYALAPDSPSLNITTAITMATWIKPSAYGTQDLIKKAVNGGTDGYELALATNGSGSPAPSKPFVRFNQVTNGDAFRVSALSDYPIDGSWMHVAATWDGSTIRLYINGVEENSTAFTGPIATNALPLGIGGQSNGARTFNGQMDDIRLYSSALSPAEIGELANRPPTVNAGPDQTGIVLPAGADLDGTVTDDALSAPLTTLWSQVSGPGTATFADASAVDTTATFTVDGTYVLRLTANDGGFETFDEVSITVQPASTISTSTFQYGVDGYIGTIDTFLSEGSPDAPQNASTILEWDQDQAGAGSQTVLIRFDDIFGNAAGQIPAGVYITSATLNYNAFEAGDSATVNEVAVDWDAAATYNNFGGDTGIQPDEYGVQIGTAPGSIGLQSVNVTSSLQSWIANPSLNRGWILRPDGGDGTDVRSSDVTTAALRPSLSVTYTTVMPNLPPTVSLVSPTDGAEGQPVGVGLTVNVSDPNGDPLTVTYHGREASVPAANFSIIALPDTQNYSGHTNGGLSSTFTAQTQWIVDQRAPRNIVFVTQLGDCVQNGNVELEWQRANSAVSLLENPTTTGIAPFGIPYGIAVGNHDQSPTGDADGDTSLYNQYFGSARFAGRPYYGGHYGSNNDNHYQLFSASGLDFIIIHLEYDTTPDAAVLAWANNLLAANPTRRGIITSHHIVNTGNPASFGTQGQAIYDALKGNANLFLMLSGHVSEEGRRTDVFGGNTVHSVLSDYQSRANGGDGWLRILNFKPSTNQIDFQTYSPTLGQFETDASSQFTLPYNMSGAGAPFGVIGTNTGVASGSNDSKNWFNILGDRQYEWYVTVSDGTHTVTSPVWNFTTATVATTAAPVTVSGRVQTAAGRSVARAYIRLTDESGNTRTGQTNAFGYFTIANVPAGQTYVLTGEARGYTFGQQLLSVTDNLTGLNIEAIPR